MSKHYRGQLTVIVLMVITLLSLSAVGAQEPALDEQPLMQMLARIPNTTLSRTEIYFNDRKAIETAYPSAKMPENFVEFMAMSEAKGQDADLLPVDLWWRVWRNQASAMSARYLQLGEETQAVVGFDYFEINQEMTYGQPPAQTLQITGDFNFNLVRDAFALRGYSRYASEDVEFWCPEAGCDAGNMQNLPNRNPANPFGGDLGRSQTLLIEDGTLISSPSEIAMQNHLDVSTGDEPSLATLPQYRAVAAAITSEGALMQAYFWDGELLLGMSDLSPAALFGTSVTQEVIERFYEDMLKDFVELPAYQLMVFADVASETEQMGQVALVYTTEEAAKTAAEVIPDRIANYQSIALRIPFTELLEERGVTKPVINIVEHADRYVVLVSFPTPKASDEELMQFNITSLEQPETTAPGLIYRLLVDAAMRRDLGWLNTIPRSAIEAIAGQ